MVTKDGDQNASFKRPLRFLSHFRGTVRFSRPQCHYAFCSLDFATYVCVPFRARGHLGVSKHAQSCFDERSGNQLSDERIASSIGDKHVCHLELTRPR